MGRLALQVELSEFKISGLRDFEVSRGAWNYGDQPTGALDKAGFVGADEFIGCRLSKSSFKQMAAETLGRLRLHDVFARNGRGDDGSVGGALDLLDSVDGGKAHYGSLVFLDSADGALDGSSIDERADGIVHEDDVIRLAVEGVEGVGDALLPGVSTGHNVDFPGKSVIADLGGDTVHFIGAYGYVHCGDPRHLGEGPQRVDEDWHTGQLEELLGRRNG